MKTFPLENHEKSFLDNTRTEQLDVTCFVPSRPESKTSPRMAYLKKAGMKQNQRKLLEDPKEPEKCTQQFILTLSTPSL